MACIGNISISHIRPAKFNVAPQHITAHYGHTQESITEEYKFLQERDKSFIYGRQGLTGYSVIVIDKNGGFTTKCGITKESALKGGTPKRQRKSRRKSRKSKQTRRK